MPISVASRLEGSRRRVARLAPALRAIVRATLALERRRPGEIAIVLADDPTLRELNRRYRGIDRATDVLSFGYELPAAAGRDGDLRGEAVGGDIVVSLDRVVQQARRFRVSEGDELTRLVIHGALHLAGLDHHQPRERSHMRRREDEAMRSTRAQARALGALEGLV